MVELTSIDDFVQAMLRVQRDQNSEAVAALEQPTDLVLVESVPEAWTTSCVANYWSPSA